MGLGGAPRYRRLPGRSLSQFSRCHSRFSSIVQPVYDTSMCAVKADVERSCQLSVVGCRYYGGLQSAVGGRRLAVGGNTHYFTFYVLRFAIPINANLSRFPRGGRGALLLSAKSRQVVRHRMRCSRRMACSGVQHPISEPRAAR